MFRALFVLLCLVVNTSFWGTLVFLGGIVKFATSGRARHRVILVLASFGDAWVGLNDRILDTFLTTRWEINGVDGLNRESHYLVMSNHVSWVDIIAVLRAFHRRSAFLRFFLKQNLIWLPILGQACWAIEFPFMKRYSPEYLKAHPEKRGRDLETTRIACRRYRHIPVTILNYVEGTRFTSAKHAEQDSPYRHLLRPRVGGVGFVLASFAEQLDALLDVTLIYPKREVTMLDLVTNRLPWIRVEVRRLDVPKEFQSDAITQPGPARDHFKAWIEEIWREKDETIERVLIESRQ